MADYWFHPNGSGQFIDDILGPSLTSPKALATILEHAPSVGTFVEIGTWGGSTAAYLASRRPGLTVLSVDPFYSDKHALLWLLNRHPNMRLFMGRSEDLFTVAGEQWADMVFVDGHHTMEAVLFDLRGSARIIRPNTSILVHDFGVPKYPGVEEGVSRFCAESGWKLEARVNELAILRPGV